MIAKTVAIALLLPLVTPVFAADKLEAAMAMALTENDEPRIAKLIAEGANPKGRMPIQRGNQSSESYLQHTVNRGLLASTTLLLEKGADVHDKGYDGAQVMHIIAKSRFENRLEIAKLLLAHGAKTQLNNFDSNGYTPVHWAATASNYDLVELFAKSGGDLDLISKNPGGGISLLTLSAYRGNADAIALLIKLGATINGEQGFEALRFAADEEHLKVVKLLADAGAPLLNPGEIAPGTPVIQLSPLHWAVYQGRPKVVAALVSAGADVDRRFEFSGGRDGVRWGGWSLLMTAVAHTDEKIALEMTTALLAGKPDLDLAVENPRYSGVVVIIPPPPKESIVIERTALSLAKEKNRPKLVQLLLEAGATPEKRP